MRVARSTDLFTRRAARYEVGGVMFNAWEIEELEDVT